MDQNEEKYLNMLQEKYPTRQQVCREIINLNAIQNLPKGTEHFMSDLHGEYEAFLHILNNCSGVIKEKVDDLFEKDMSKEERRELCTLLYYPKEKLKRLHAENRISDDWYRMVISRLVAIAKRLSSKYTRNKVRSAMPEDFAFIIDELLHAQQDEDDNQVIYHQKIVETMIRVQNADEFIIAIASLIKTLAVDHLHIVGDVFDRGGQADKIMDLLMKHHSIDFQWGNHDILWMGACCGSMACIANVLRNNLKYQNTAILENAYGISLRPLTLFARETYQKKDSILAAYEAISVIAFKLEGQIIKRHPEYEMEDRCLLEKIDETKKTVQLSTGICELKEFDFPTVQKEDPYRLTQQEEEIMEKFRIDFTESAALKRHIRFLYEKGSLYKIYNGNLLFHGCVPMDFDGNFSFLTIGQTTCAGKDFYDMAEKMARDAFYKKRDENHLDFMWFLWGAEKSPLCGRKLRTFERMYTKKSEAWDEPKNPYYSLYHKEEICLRILREFGLYQSNAHIINGHTPVRAIEGESPVRANGRLIVIDGGFSSALHETTGIAGYTLINNSHGLRIKAHHPFLSVEMALKENQDIESDSKRIEIARHRVMVKDTDKGKEIKELIEDLYKLLNRYDS